MLYGQTLRMPGEFFTSTENTTETEFVNKFRDIIRDLAPTTTQWNANEKPFVNKELSNCSRVFIRNDKIKPALTNNYDGRFPIAKKHEKYFEVDIASKNTKVSMDRLKPTFFASDDPPSPHEGTSNSNNESIEFPLATQTPVQSTSANEPIAHPFSINLRRLPINNNISAKGRPVFR